MTAPNISTPTSRALDISTIYYEPAVVDYARGREILEHFGDTDRIEVTSHWNIPGSMATQDPSTIG